MSIVLLMFGLATLLLGADVLVRSASGLAHRLGVSTTAIGLTVVAFGTSAPELAVSLTSVRAGNPEVAVGNVVGSNIFNVLFVLGASALLRQLAVDARVMRVDVPIMIGASCAAWAFARDGHIGKFEGALLMLAITGYTALTIRGAREGARDLERRHSRGRPPLLLAGIAIGLALTLIGSRWFVRGAVDAAQSIGVDALTIGLTIVATGTSLPEAATSIVAAVRRERDLAVANVVGSNIFNLLAILGATALASPTPLGAPAPTLARDFPVMTGVAIVCLPVVLTGRRIARSEGLAFLLLYAGYVAWTLQ